MIIHCPKCKQQYDVEASLVGRRVECVCGHKWNVFFEQPKPKMSRAEMIVRAIILMVGIALTGYGIKGQCFPAEHDSYREQVNSEFGSAVAIVLGILVIPFAFVSLNSGMRRFYFICPNPNCGWQGTIEYNQDAGTLKNVATILLLQSAGFRTVLYDNPTVTCPRCGMRVPHAR